MDVWWRLTWCRVQPRHCPGDRAASPKQWVCFHTGGAAKVSSSVTAAAQDLHPVPIQVALLTPFPPPDPQPYLPPFFDHVLSRPGLYLAPLCSPPSGHRIWSAPLSWAPSLTAPLPSECLIVPGSKSVSCTHPERPGGRQTHQLGPGHTGGPGNVLLLPKDRQRRAC